METTLPTKSFKEVHEELEKEHTFLQQNHNISDFKTKARFLSTIGFSSSIATKLYFSIAENHNLIKEYGQRYNGQYKFILEPQLERVCEKYNLFVRNLDLFIGDIPEKNIADMMKFKVDLCDLPKDYINYLRQSPIMGGGTFYNDEFILGRPTTSPKYSLEQLFGLFRHESIKQGLIQIAAVKPMFTESAFSSSQARIIKNTGRESTPKGQVDLDPIVLFRTAHGYLIITAWGDEANDELVANHNNN